MKIVCIGRNYREHAKELNNPVPKEPVIFMKPDSALLRNNDPFYYPDFSKDIHYELEVVVRINKLGKSISEEFAPRYYDEIGLGIDLTARDIQKRCKEKGLPWERAKAFDFSAVQSTFISKKELPPVDALHFQLEKNGKIVQDGFTGDMLFPINQLIAEISKYFTLKIGDLIYTGTPEGVGSLAIGDKLKGTLEGQSLLDFEVK
ncbi:2-keto-4-pentenoate hydratase/2-oxohepta-3-ene-1,7-dioic acid hydratase in catechol pathway [Balneicella halophila]|uniref:2-keto-4-pentenoate hydratase/2-oxohepta-3-ene-1,7-dioic acid hydratase in catechol pathway n=1 Tax=Balneicella halophila TaxID=1537566 RepID=A0A7L4URT1_BALHA|nr:fumarylacetoacetate hydrolase family protein [Balneicella halophila]PVX52463.1 2-keto-4-pentenoate hydratase/2-oxohepta-3-ene-1,7-dioic acid hydratase in catechol pathway [Balneicella halophila]